jgi:D-alanine-D-alanine ligase
MHASGDRLRGREVYVLVPDCEAVRAATGRVPDGYDYDAPAYRNEVTGWLDALGLVWFWQPVGPATLDTVLDRLAERRCLVLNLCDGNEEVDGFPGISVVRALERRRIGFTGAGSAFFAATTSKSAMKASFRANGVSTPDFHTTEDPDRSVAAACQQLGFPLIVKPDISGGSYGISRKSIVDSETEAREQVQRVLAGLHGFDFRRAGVLLERFISGREFTALLFPTRDGGRVLPAERVFHPDLTPRQRLLSFEEYWNVGTPEPLPAEPFYRYAAVTGPLRERLEHLCRQAYHAVGGDSYARIDLRADDGGNAFVLEVNANCGLSSDPEQSSVGQICRINQVPFLELLTAILEQAVQERISPGSGRRL